MHVMKVNSYISKESWQLKIEFITFYIEFCCLVTFSSKNSKYQKDDSDSVISFIFTGIYRVDVGMKVTTVDWQYVFEIPKCRVKGFSNRSASNENLLAILYLKECIQTLYALSSLWIWMFMWSMYVCLVLNPYILS